MFFSPLTNSLSGLSTQHTLVLIDELGRGTSPREGLGISYAISEQLITIKACARHFILEGTNRLPVLRFLCYVRTATFFAMKVSSSSR